MKYEIDKEEKYLIVLQQYDYFTTEMRNMMAGHAVIKVFAGFAFYWYISPVSIVAITGIYALEVLVAFIQAYVFAILTCVYLKDALHPHH